MLSPVEELSDLYRRNDGTLRQCRHATTALCLRECCNAYGCYLAGEILKRQVVEETT